MPSAMAGYQAYRTDKSSPVTNYHRVPRTKNVPTSNTTIVTKRTIHGLIFTQRVRTGTTICSLSLLSAKAGTRTRGMWLTSVHVEWSTGQKSSGDLRQCEEHSHGGQGEQAQGSPVCPLNYLSCECKNAHGPQRLFTCWKSRLRSRGHTPHGGALAIFEERMFPWKAKIGLMKSRKKY